MSTHNPNDGQKVTSTKTAPYKTEGAGEIPTSSLAADSIRAGGVFASNRGAEVGSGATEDTRARAPGTKDSAFAGVETQTAYAGAAPSYVNVPVAKGGPKGANLTEGGFAGSGTGEGALPEPGSRRDPARLAEENMGLGRMEGRTSGGRAGGEGEQPFGALERDESL
ncbi:hypothetical protein B0T19DRAFT_456447 [Cercophora scortea]|uniref:Uncharacterized protein n=1 Tax=Cercophora scortea TaxID=314031 RepID=A0AAE0IWQ1_9PEZI|nr:hypothetical protein B0T19DRAFT_456447 [Cercophora scortea]